MAGDTSATSRSKPTIQVPPRGFLYANGFSPGPMTLVSTFFPEQSPFSFSQLLAGAMASPPAYDSGKYGNIFDDGKNSEGRKWDSPVNLVDNPLFMVPPGLLSPLQSPFGMSHQQALAHVTAQAALSQLHPTQPDPQNSQKERSESEVRQSGKNGASASDGYHWRKYGQKQVKASECPRSYYKCTHPNCPVKKRVQQSLDGHVSEITYKANHNHDPPKPNNREKDASQDQTAILHIETSHQSLEPYAVGKHKDDAKDTHDRDADQPTAKRRSLDGGHEAAAESKIVLQTRSEVDLLDDGYKWRKYGQKLVKGNPYPRSYYRCTYGGCNVRKHVERASADPKSVITTYEGKHIHDIPLGKHTVGQQLETQKVVS